MARRRASFVCAAALLLTLIAGACEAAVRTYVLTGQGGKFTSFCMASYAGQLKKDPRLAVTVHLWRHYGDVVNSIRKLPLDTPVVVVGYSLGANATTWIAANVTRQIDLIVAYDPSVLSTVYVLGLHVRRAILYHNTSFDPWGHARIIGFQVETVETRMPHLAVDCSKKLHAITTEAIRRVHQGGY